MVYYHKLMLVFGFIIEHLAEAASSVRKHLKAGTNDNVGFSDIEQASLVHRQMRAESGMNELKRITVHANGSDEIFAGFKEKAPTNSLAEEYDPCSLNFPHTFMQQLTRIDVAQNIPASLKSLATDGKQDLIDSVLTGKQLCQGNFTEVHDDRVAMMLTGLSFRAKNFVDSGHISWKTQCTSGTKQSQHMLIASHLSQVVLPLEQIGFVVDVFLTHLGCDDQAVAEHMAGDHPPATKELTSDDALNFLMDGYGRQRVAGVLRSSSTRDQQQHKHDMLRFVADHARVQGKTYSYFIQIRYDLMIHTTKGFFETLSTEKKTSSAKLLAARNGLTYMTSIEDFMFAYPGGLANCMEQLFQNCLPDTLNFGSPLDVQACHQWGPVDLEPFKKDQYAAFGSIASRFKSWENDEINLYAGPYSASSVLIPKNADIARMASCEMHRVVPAEAQPSEVEIRVSDLPNVIVPYFHCFFPS